MSFKHEDEIDMNLFTSVLHDAVAKVKTEENPEVMNDLKKAYKQSVPFTLRMYVAAYLAKSVMVNTGKNASHTRHELREGKINSGREWKSREARDKVATTDQNTGGHKEEQKEHAQHMPKVQIDESLATTIFVGIGRNRRVYPRDLVGLLVSVAGLDRDRIGDIRVLANYSFVQLFADDADRAITALNGYDYRGRKLSVSFSRQKGEGELPENHEKAGEQVLESKAEPPAAGVVDADAAAEDAAAYAAAEKAAADKEPFSAPLKSYEGSDQPSEHPLV